MPVIRVDADVRAAIDRRREPGDSYTDTIRRLLGLPGVASRTEDLPDPPDRCFRGRLRVLLDAGLLHAGQTVTWERPQRGETHTATVDEAGYLVTADGTAHLTPDMAATDIARYPCKGWPVWRTDAGATLAELRQRLERATSPAQPTPPAQAVSWAKPQLRQLVRAGLLSEGQTLTWDRPILRVTHTATVTAEGRLITTDGEIHPSPSAAATALAGSPCNKAWAVWHTDDGTTLAELRQQLIDATDAPRGEHPSGTTEEDR